MVDTVSLLPAATEIVCALGQQARLAAVSHECDFPSSVIDLPKLTSTRVGEAATGAAIHDRVRNIIERGLALYDVDAELLRQLSPAVIVTQTQCEACAASPRDLQQALRDWTSGTPDVVSLEALTLHAVMQDICAVASAMKVERAGVELVSRIEGRIDAARARAAACTHRPRVGVLEWLSPLMAGGNWMPELVDLAGCEPIWGKAGEHSPWLDEAQIAADDPEILLVIPCGYDLAETQAEYSALKELGCWPDLHAVRAGKVFACDGNAFFNRPGPRIVESIDIVYDIAHGRGARDAKSGYGWVLLN